MKPTKKINLTCIKSCNQVWENMLPNELGRLCQKCNETIIDFRNLTDDEIIKIHASSGNKTCGIYTKQQVKSETNKRIDRKKIPNLLITFLGLVSSANSIAQTNIPLEISEQTESLLKGKTIDSLTAKIPMASNIVIHGTVRDEMGELMIGAAIYIKGTKFGISSDMEGKYILDLTEYVDSLEQIILIGLYLGYDSVEITLDKKQLLREHSLKVDMIFRESLDIGSYIGLYIIKPRFLKERFIEGNFELDITTSASWGLTLQKDGQYTYYISVFKHKKSILETGRYQIKNSILSFYPDLKNETESLVNSQFKIHKKKLTEEQRSTSLRPYSQISNTKNTYWVLIPIDTDDKYSE